MIKIKRIEFVECRNKLAQLNNCGIELPANISLALVEILSELDNLIREFKQRKLSLIKEYQDDPNGFNKESMRLMLEEVILKSEPIPIKLLDNVFLSLINARKLQRFTIK